MEDRTYRPRSLYVLQHQRCGCSLSTPTSHWALYLADPDDNLEDPDDHNTGTLFLPVYSLDEESIPRVFPSISGDSGHLDEWVNDNVPGYEPSQSERLFLVARGIRAIQVDDICKEILHPNQTPGRNKCQDFVLRALVWLLHYELISEADHDRVSHSIRHHSSTAPQGLVNGVSEQ